MGTSFASVCAARACCATKLACDTDNDEEFPIGHAIHIDGLAALAAYAESAQFSPSPVSCCSLESEPVIACTEGIGRGQLAGEGAGKDRN